MFSLFICIIVNIVFILFYLQVEPVYLRVSNKPIQITSCVINIGNTCILTKFILMDSNRDIDVLSDVILLKRYISLRLPLTVSFRLTSNKEMQQCDIETVCSSVLLGLKGIHLIIQK